MDLSFRLQLFVTLLWVSADKCNASKRNDEDSYHMTAMAQHVHNAKIENSKAANSLREKFIKIITKREAKEGLKDPTVCKKGRVSEEKRLIKELMTRYREVGVVGRPVCDTLDTVNVEYGISLIQIMDLDERDQVLTTNVWCTYRWHDILLRWDPAEYDDVTIVRIPSSEIWKPDIVLYNYADQRLSEHRTCMALVDYNGSVFWMPPAIFKSSCQIDITNFPFDQQKCHMKFGSWTYDGNQLNISFNDKLPAFEMNDYMESHEWEVLGYPAVRNVKYYPCCKEPYPDLTFHLKLQRKGAFYNYILLLPCVLLSTLTLVLFWLPPESPAKTLLAKKTPPAASNVPLIGAYYCLNMILITLSTFLSVMIMIDGLARMLRMRDDIPPRPDVEINKMRKKKGMPVPKKTGDKNLVSGLTESSNDPARIPVEVHEIKSVMSGVIKRFADKDNFGRVQMEWRLVALVCDRLFFFSYLLAIIVSLITVFPRTQVYISTGAECWPELAGCQNTVK